MLSRYKNNCTPSNKMASNFNLCNMKAFLSLPRLLLGSLIVIIISFMLYFINITARNRHRIAITNLQFEVMGYGHEDIPPENIEKRMQEKVPQLLKLVNSAPRSERIYAERVLATWRAHLGYSDAIAKPYNVWDRIYLAQRCLALGKSQEAADLLLPLRKSAYPDKPWASMFWHTVINLDRMRGDRKQGWIDLSEYKTLFKDKAEPEIERLLNSI